MTSNRPFPFLGPRTPVVDAGGHVVGARYEPAPAGEGRAAAPRPAPVGLERFARLLALLMFVSGLLIGRVIA